MSKKLQLCFIFTFLSFGLYAQNFSSNISENNNENTIIYSNSERGDISSNKMNNATTQFSNRKPKKRLRIKNQSSETEQILTSRSSVQATIFTRLLIKFLFLVK